MVKWVSILIVFLFSHLVQAEDVCRPPVYQFAWEAIKEFVTRSCADTKASQECQDLYAEMRKNGETPEDKALQCSNQNVVLRALKKDFDFRMGCAIGGWSFAVDTVVSLATALGEGTAKAVISVEKAKAENASCDKDPEKKKAVYTDYNNSVPKMLRIEVPDEATFQRVDCARLKAGARMMQARQGFFAMDKVRSRISDPNAKYNADEQEYVNWIHKMKGRGGKFPDIIALAEAKLKEMGVKLECYNDREAAALICEAVAAVATLAAGPAGAAMKAARASKIAKLAGLREVKAAAAEKALKRELTEKQKAAVVDAHNVGTAEGRGYRTQGGAPGEYTWADLKSKAKKMKAADFDKAERRLLMESGVTGNPVNPATTLGRADQAFISKIDKALARRSTEHLNEAASEGAKYYKAKSGSTADLKKAFPENDVTGIVEANYFGLGTEDTAKLASKYFETYGYNANYGKLTVISRLRQETRYYMSADSKVDSNIADYRIYRNKELEYKLWTDYYESRYPNKYNELDFDKLSPGQRKNLENLNEEVQKLREKAQKNKWPGFEAASSGY